MQFRPGTDRIQRHLSCWRQKLPTHQPIQSLRSTWSSVVSRMTTSKKRTKQKQDDSHPDHRGTAKFQRSPACQTLPPSLVAPPLRDPWGPFPPPPAQLEDDRAEDDQLSPGWVLSEPLASHIARCRQVEKKRLYLLHLEVDVGHEPYCSPAAS